jgi:hypothetical protein
MGTLIVHRLTNDRDREVVERACGEIDRSASAFLPNLKPGEAAILGAEDMHWLFCTFIRISVYTSFQAF